MSSTVTDDARNLLIEVENFDNVTPASDGNTTFLRIGAVPDTIKSTYEGLNQGGSDTAAFKKKTGEDLASQVRTFVDDTRDRGTGDFLTLSPAERQAQTEALHTGGGWRDHTDGNRVTTTRGDKVEVIGGNYKLLVLGREQWNDDAGVGLHHESSGGITYHYDEVPGQIVDVRRRSNGKTWQVIEETNTGHFVTRFHGVDKDWHQGGDLKTRIGSRGAYRVAFEGAAWDAVKGDHGFRSDSDFDKPSDAAHTADVAWPGDERLPNVREEVFADTVEERLHCRNVEEIDGEADRWMGSFTEHTWCKKINEMQTFVYYEQKMRGETAQETWEGLFFECFLGALAITTKFGAFVDMRYGWVSVDFNLPYKAFTQLNLTLRRTQFELAALRLAVTRASVGIVEARAAAAYFEHEAFLVKHDGVKWEFSLSNQID
ncbi:MAG: hypothetical protein AAGA56_07990 [Myxococcota bacterium]